MHFTGDDPRRCVPPEGTAPGQLEVTRACAEMYVLLGGYTGRLASKDTTLLIREMHEVGSWDFLVHRRRYIVDPKSFDAECSLRGCIVFFRKFKVGPGCLAVRMSQDYADLHFGVPESVELMKANGKRRC